MIYSKREENIVWFFLTFIVSFNFHRLNNLLQTDKSWFCRDLDLKNWNGSLDNLLSVDVQLLLRFDVNFTLKDPWKNAFYRV